MFLSYFSLHSSNPFYMIKKIAAALAVIFSTFPVCASHTVVAGKLEDSRLYPGTTHTFSVVVPDAYVPGDSAALYLGLDGVLCNAPAVIDSLTAAGVMPVTVQVYLQSGLIRDGRGEVLRYNRSNEFDATDGRFAEFLATELLPAVENMTAADGRRIVLTRNPAKRVIFGLSSGGIAAFNAAWHRPDMFGKVYSGCGTFVPMRGGEQLQAVVRKHEPLPLRVFLQDGFSDSWNPLFGSWYEANRLLASALQFAGYDCDFDWAEGGHSVVRTSQIFPQVMTWMFRDGDSAIAPGNTGNNFLAPRLVPGENWTAADNGYPGAADVVQAIYPDSTHVAYPCAQSNCLMQALVDSAGNRVAEQRFYYLHSNDNSAVHVADMAFDADGYLWVITDMGLQVLDQNGRVRGILRLPRDFDTAEARIIILPGAIRLASPTATIERRLNVAPPTPGVRPPGQGQG